jgi:hypothetical protein
MGARLPWVLAGMRVVKREQTPVPYSMLIDLNKGNVCLVTPAGFDMSCQEAALKRVVHPT